MAPSRQTLEPIDTEQVARLRLAVGRLARQLRRSSTAGLTLSQLSALASVELLEPVRLSDLAAREGVAAPTMTRIAAYMVDTGLCARHDCPDDARSALLSTTVAGRTALRAVREERTQALAQRLEALDPRRRYLLPDAVELLEALVELDER